jgi:hypothetical protein
VKCGPPRQIGPMLKQRLKQRLKENHPSSATPAINISFSRLIPELLSMALGGDKMNHPHIFALIVLCSGFNHQTLAAPAMMGAKDAAKVAAKVAVLDTAVIRSHTGLAGKWNAAEGVYKVSQPRTDVRVSVDEAALPPFMGLTSWASFMAGDKTEAMVMGDLVLFQDEVNPVMSLALQTGLQVTALHNHFFYDEPKVYFMHIAGEDSAAKLASGIRAVLDKVKEIRSAAPTPSRSFGGGIPAAHSITASKIEKALGAKGESKDGMFKAVFGRTAKMPCGCEAGKDMGVNTWAAFMGSDDKAVVDGDFVVLEGELQGVLKSLRSSGINVVAIHHHMLGESPRMLFLHYWGKGPVESLAQAVKTALAQTGR